MDEVSVTRPSPPSTKALVANEGFCRQVAALLLCDSAYWMRRGLQGHSRHVERDGRRTFRPCEPRISDWRAVMTFGPRPIAAGMETIAIDMFRRIPLRVIAR